MITTSGRLYITVYCLKYFTIKIHLVPFKYLLFVLIQFQSSTVDELKRLEPLKRYTRFMELNLDRSVLNETHEQYFVNFTFKLSIANKIVEFAKYICACVSLKYIQ